MVFLYHHVKAQLPFLPGNFMSSPGTVMQQLPDPHSNSQYLSFQHGTSPGSSKGFTLNMGGTTRTDLNLDLPVYEGSTAANTMEINLNNTASFLFSKAAESGMATIQYQMPPAGDPEFPVVITPLTIVVHDEMDLEHPLVVMPGTFGSMMLAGPLSPNPTENEAYLIGMSIIPDGSGSIMQLFFHSKMIFTIGGNTISGQQLDIHLAASYSSIGSVSFTLNQIQAPVSVFTYVTDPMPLAMSMPLTTSLYTNDVLTITGNNFLYLGNVLFNGLPLLFNVADNYTVQVIMPSLPGTSSLTLQSLYGDVISPGVFTVTAPPQCDAMPQINNLFFYLPTPSTVNAVLKWDYSGDPLSVFEVRYREVSTPGWTTVNTGMVRELTVSVTPELEYEFQVNATCPNMLVSGWSDPRSLIIGYSDVIYVSAKLDRAIDVWRLDSVNHYPLDSFLVGYNDGGNTPDPNEIDGFVMRFFQTSPLFFGKMPPATCVCRQVMMEYSLSDNGRDNAYIREGGHTQRHRRKDYLVGQIRMGYNYKGASTRNYAFCQDFQAWCNGRERRHTEKSNNITEENILGDKETRSPSLTQLNISYLCANTMDMVRTDCGCEKKVYISAKSTVNMCRTAESQCTGHTNKEAGSVAEVGGGSIIVTGLVGNTATAFSTMRVLDAGFSNLQIVNSYESHINPDFVKKGIRLLQSVAMGVATVSAGDFLTLFAGGTFDKAFDDLVDLIGTKATVEQYDQTGNNGCKEFIVSTLYGDYITIFPNEKRYVAIATNSYAAVRGYGCHYRAEASFDATHHIAAATDRLEFSASTACCMQPSAIYSTYSIDGNYNVNSGGSSHKELIGKLLFDHGDRKRASTPPYTRTPAWYDATGLAPIVNDVVIPSEFAKTNGIYGRLAGLYKTDCEEDSLHEISKPTGTGEAFYKENTSLLVYPNAVKDHTTIEYTLRAATGVTLTVYDMAGKKVLELLNGVQHAPGTYKVNADLGQFINGQYIVLLSSNHRNAYQYILKK